MKRDRFGPPALCGWETLWPLQLHDPKINQVRLHGAEGDSHRRSRVPIFRRWVDAYGRDRPVLRRWRARIGFHAAGCEIQAAVDVDASPARHLEGTSTSSKWKNRRESSPAKSST